MGVRTHSVFTVCPNDDITTPVKKKVTVEGRDNSELYNRFDRDIFSPYH